MRFLASIASATVLVAGCAGLPESLDIPLNGDQADPEMIAPEGQRPITMGGDPAVEVSQRAPIEWSQSSNYQANGPYPVVLSDVPTAQYDPHNKIARGWGLDGPKWATKRISKEEAARLRAEAMNLTPNARIDTGPEGIQRKAPVAGISFDSLDISDCCGGGANVPPDPELAVGPNHIIAIVNVAFEIYDKSGTLLQGPTTLSSFFAGTPGCSNTATFDPNVLYDEEADRFIIGADGNGTDYCVAATTGPDPLGTWNRYGFATNIGGAFFDYPHAGVGVDAIFMGSNQFGGTPGFEGRVFAMDKAAMYSGAAMSVATHSTGADGTPQPMNLHGFLQGTWPVSGPHYIMTEVFDGANHTVWSWNDPFGANTFSRDGDLNLNIATGVTAGFPVSVPQAGSAALLQANDWRGLDTEYRNGEIYITNTIACNPGGGTVDCIRWARIDPAAPAVLDAGVYATSGEYRFFPDVGVNHCGDMAVGYTKSSTSIFPSIFVNGREATDPAGTLQVETQLKAGEVTYTAFDGSPHRWGDYTGMTIDPDGQTFWYLGEYSKNTGNQFGRWGTYIGSFSYPTCSGEPNPFTLQDAVPMQAGTINTWGVTGATAGTRMGLIYGTSAGTTTINIQGCPPFDADIASARLADRATADGSGNGTFSRFVPQSFSGTTALLQAVDAAACSVSNVIQNTF